MAAVETILSTVDTILITPYRTGLPSIAAFWLGTAVLALWCTVAGEISMTLGYIWNRKYYNGLNQKMIRMHNISIEAIRHKDKSVFKSANTWANEYFGKVFFSHAALFAISLWPMPFALGWLQQRFSGIDIHTVPVLDYGLEYPFVFISSYILTRYAFSKVRKFIPLLGRIDKMKEQDALEAGEMKSWNELAPAEKKATDSQESEKQQIFTEEAGAKTAS